MQIEGAIGTALVDVKDGLTLATAGGGDRLNLEVAGAGNVDVVRAKMRVMEQLGLGDNIEDILITLESQYHLIRPLNARLACSSTLRWIASRATSAWRASE